MQTLVKRNTYTPTGTPRSNCDQSLKVLRGRDGVADLKTFSNSSDLTAREQAGQDLRVPVVFVLCQGEREATASLSSLVIHPIEKEKQDTLNGLGNAGTLLSERHPFLLEGRGILDGF